MNVTLGLNNTQFGTPNNKTSTHKLQQAKLDKFTKHHQSSKDLRIPSGAFKSESGTPKNERNSSSNVNSPKSFSSAMNYSSTPKGLKTGSNLSGGFSNRNKSWNMTPQPSSFRAPKDSSSSSKFINTANHRTSNDNKSMSKFLDSRLDTKDRSTIEDSSYFDSLKLFTEEGDMSILQSARRKSTELNASFRQQLLRSAGGGATDKPKTNLISKANSAKNLKAPLKRQERPGSSQFGKTGNSNGKSVERMDMKERLIKGKTNSEGGSSSASKILFTNWKDVEDNLTTPGTPSKMEDDERISLKDIIRLGSKTPQPDSSANHSFGGGNELFKLLKEKEQDKKTIKALQDQVMKLQELFDEMKDHRDSPNFAQNVVAKTENTDLKEKEMSFLKIQNDTLKMTVDILKGENDILKNAQKQMAQFKEAAKRYRDLANSKSEECVRLAEEVINLRKDKGLSVAASPTSLHVTTPTKYDPTIKVESIFSPKSNRNVENIRKSAASSFSGHNAGENLVTENLETEASEIKPPLPEIACEKPINYY